MLNLRARAALAAVAAEGSAAARGHRSRRLLRTAARDTRKMERNPIVYSCPLALLIRAGIATLQDQTHRAPPEIEEQQDTLKRELQRAASRSGGC